MSWNADALFALLPSIHRTRDAEQGYPLRQFLTVLAEQARVLEEGAARLYDDAFVETCADWVLPYIGDLIGYRTIYGVAAATNCRAELANTISYRQRKGTVVMLEQLAFDVTGWPAHAKEFFQILRTNQHLNHVRSFNLASPDLRQWQPIERLGGAFDSMSHHPEVGRLPVGEGRHNVRNVGLFLWRLAAYPLRLASAGPHPADPRRFFFSPLSADAPLFNAPVAEATITSLSAPLNVPEPISRRRFAENLADYYPRALCVFANGAPVAVANIRGCNLADAGGGAWAHGPNNVVAIDPVLGRISFPPNQPPPQNVLVDWHYGFSRDMGGGSYARAASFAPDIASLRIVPNGGLIQPDLDQVQAGGVVEIADSLTHAGGVAITADPAARVELRAADGQRPVVMLGGDLVITGGADSEINLNGLLIAGGRILVLAAGNVLRRLTIRHCTLVPGQTLAMDGTPNIPGTPSLVVEAPNVLVEIEQSILGPIYAAPTTRLHLLDSIVDATQRTMPALASADGSGIGPELYAIDTTIIGKVNVTAMMLVSNSILEAALAPADTWTAAVRSQRHQIGCVRYSYVPPNSRTPRRYRTQSDHAVATALRARTEIDPLISQAEIDAITAAVRARVVPAWTDQRYGRPAYGQLRRSTPIEIRTGADDESEVGAFHKLYQPQRETNLRIRLDEYLGVGLEAGLIFET